MSYRPSYHAGIVNTDVAAGPIHVHLIGDGSGQRRFREGHLPTRDVSRMWLPAEHVAHVGGVPQTRLRAFGPGVEVDPGVDEMPMVWVYVLLLRNESEVNPFRRATRLVKVGRDRVVGDLKPYAQRVG